MPSREALAESLKRTLLDVIADTPDPMDKRALTWLWIGRAKKAMEWTVEHLEGRDA